MDKLIPLALVVAAFFGGKMFLEHQADRMVTVAQEMAEDGELDAALDKVREVESWFAWTEAAEQAEEVKDFIRSNRRAKARDAEQERRFREIEQQYREETEKAEERRLQEERLEKQMENERFRIREEARSGKSSSRRRGL